MSDKSDETIHLHEWVEAIQDVASLEKELRGTSSNPHKQQILLKARRGAVERVLAIRYLTGATTDRIEMILETEPWAAAFYNELSEETPDDMARPNSQREDHRKPPPDSGGLSSWYEGASPFSEGR